LNYGIPDFKTCPFGDPLAAYHRPACISHDGLVQHIQKARSVFSGSPAQPFNGLHSPFTASNWYPVVSDQSESSFLAGKHDQSSFALLPGGTHFCHVTCHYSNYSGLYTNEEDRIFDPIGQTNILVLSHQPDSYPGLDSLAIYVLWWSMVLTRKKELPIPGSLDFLVNLVNTIHLPTP